ncbi:MAG: hypothetical protein ACP5VP_06955 [Candidatus Limnocylindrales bacterium]
MIRVVRGLLGSPIAWLAGSAGFLARGGVLVLALPILTLPTPVGVSLLVPPLAVTTSGISSVLVPELIAAGLVLAICIVLSLVVAALAETIQYEQEAKLLSPAAPLRQPPGMGGTVVRLVGVEVAALLPAALVAILALQQLAAVGEQEYLLPSSTGASYVERVLQGAAAPLVGLGLCLLLADLLNAVASRRVLRRVYVHDFAPSDAAAATSAGRTARRLARVAGIWALTWLITLATLAPSLAAIEVAWSVARDTYTATMRSTPPSPISLMAAAVALGAAFTAAVLLAGLGSAMRSVLWTVAARHEGGVPSRAGPLGPSATLGRLDGVPQEARAR